jgi:hypothetical protein
LSDIEVTVYPQHVIPWHSVQIAMKTEKPFEVCYHFISPEAALSLLAQLERERATLEQMAAQEQPA